MMSAPPSVAAAGWPLDDPDDLARTVSAFLDRLGTLSELLALGEPTHGEPALPALRNRLFAVLADHGFRSIALESDAVAALAVDAFVADGGGTLDSAMAQGFSHGFGQLEANRELVAWMRSYNASRPASEHLAFYGCDAPLEMGPAPSPRRFVGHLHAYLAEHLGPSSLASSREHVEHLLGPDEHWSDPAALMDATQSVGASPEAAGLRVIADDLMTVLLAQAPRLVATSSLADWQRAELHGRTARGLLRYHAEMARSAGTAERTARLLGVRDALMAENLLAVRAREQQRGPTLVFAHNRHLQRHPSTLRLAGRDLEWNSAGAIIATLVGDRYAFIAGSLGAIAMLGLPAPAADTIEGALQAATRECVLFDATRLRAAVSHAGTVPHPRPDVTAQQGYFPLDAATLEHCDAVVHVATSPAPPAPTADELAARILALPDVTCVRADEQSGAPAVSWGDRFFYAGADRRMPFATIIEHDYPDWDEASRLDRPGVFRLNIELGREAFERELGIPPAAFAAHRASIDFARLDQLLPHPSYGTQGWACILNPSTRRLPHIDRLVDAARRRALDRRPRASGN